MVYVRVVPKRPSKCGAKRKAIRLAPFLAEMSGLSERCLSLENTEPILIVDPAALRGRPSDGFSTMMLERGVPVPLRRDAEK